MNRLPPETEAKVLSVGQLNGQIRDTLLTTFRGLWVAGEISDLSRPRSGHLYFSLKDASGSIKAISWRSNAQRLRFTPEDGMQVLCCGDIDVYPPRGTYQLIVRSMQLQGEGQLQAQLRKLRAQLAAEGLFAVERKRRLPRFPRCIAIVTSASGAALRDFLQVVRRRWTHARLLVIPTDVQGVQAAPQIAAAIGQASRIRPQADAILVTRGGGSLEDLWAFNDERVVRAIYAAPIPVVSAVGHEIDVTLSDLVADVRALTPTEAGELMVPDAAEISQHLTTQGQRLNAVLQARLTHAASRLESLTNRRVLRRPFLTIRERERMLDELQRRAQGAVERHLERVHHALKHAASKLEALSPLKVLSRGYAVAQKMDGTVVQRAEQLQIEEAIRIRLAKGQVEAVVRERMKTSGPW